MPSPVLSTRLLNRSLLARQHLLERVAMPAAGMVEHLVGMQAQVPIHPYFALWSRLDAFDPAELEHLITTRRVVRIGLMRTTLHLVTAADALALWPLFRSVLERAFRSSTPFRRNLEGVDLDQLLAAATALIDAEPMTAAQLGARLAERWPDRDRVSLSAAARFLLPVVQPPPRGLWSATGQPMWTTLDSWLGRPLAGAADVERVVLRYLSAFGPASVSDIRTWSGLAGLREGVDRLRPRLKTFRDESGRELFDVPDGPMPAAETPAPPRFLPEYDNLLLSHADRRRVVRPEVRARITGFAGTFLVDGFVRGQWRLATTRDAVATLVIEPFEQLAEEASSDLADEGRRLLDFAAAAAAERRIEFGSVRQPGGEGRRA